MNHCCCSELLYGTIGTDSMAELKEEDSHTAATDTQLPTAATGDHSRTLSELHHALWRVLLLCNMLFLFPQALLSQ